MYKIPVVANLQKSSKHSSFSVFQFVDWMNPSKEWKWNTTPSPSISISIIDSPRFYLLPIRKKKARSARTLQARHSKEKMVSSELKDPFLMMAMCGGDDDVMKSSNKTIGKQVVPSLKLTFSHLKMDGWNRILSFWGNRPIFRCKLAVSFRECILLTSSYISSTGMLD